MFMVRGLRKVSRKSIRSDANERRGSAKFIKRLFFDSAVASIMFDLLVPALVAAFHSAMERRFCCGVVDVRAACTRSTNSVLPHWVRYRHSLQEVRRSARGRSR